MSNDIENQQGQLYIVGSRGYSAYEVAVQNGFVGTEEEWLESLKGEQGEPGTPFGDLTPEQKEELRGEEGKSAYEVAVDNGYQGTEEEWVNDFLTPDGYYNKDDVDEKLDMFPIVTPEMFGAKGDGVTDDITAMQKAFNTGKLIVFGKNKTYLVKQPIIIYEGTTVEMNGSILTGEDVLRGNHLFHNFLSTDTYLGYNGNGNLTIRNGIIQKGSIELIHGENILFENIGFKNCTRDHYIEICACKNVTVRDCTFKGMPTGDTSRKEYINIDNCVYSNFPYMNENSVMYDGTVVHGVLIDNCSFDINDTVMEDAVGKHSYYSSDHTLNKAENITIRNCKVYGATECAFYFLGAKNIVIANCYTEDSKSLFSIDNCSNVKVHNCISKNIILQSTITDCDNIIITNNYTSTGANSFDIQICGICDKITYSFNKFENKYGGRNPIAFLDSATLTVTELSAFDNNFSTSASHGNLISTPQTVNEISFGKIDHVNFVGSIGSNTATNNIYDLTQFNRLVLEMGAISLGTYQEIVIKSFVDRNFQVGETFYFAYPRGVDNPGVELGSITITDEHTLTSTGITIRHVICQNLPRM